jgi:hypothetical protein
VAFQGHSKLCTQIVHLPFLPPVSCWSKALAWTGKGALCWLCEGHPISSTKFSILQSSSYLSLILNGLTVWAFPCGTAWVWKQ